MVLHARVKDARFVIDEPADLAEGSVIELVPADEWMPAARKNQWIDDMMRRLRGRDRRV
jgi:hypothetical protein